jgi:hypothetical protein
MRRGHARYAGSRWLQPEPRPPRVMSHAATVAIDARCRSISVDADQSPRVADRWLRREVSSGEVEAAREALQRVEVEVEDAVTRAQYGLLAALRDERRALEAVIARGGR